MYLLLNSSEGQAVIMGAPMVRRRYYNGRVLIGTVIVLYQYFNGSVFTIIGTFVEIFGTYCTCVSGLSI